MREVFDGERALEDFETKAWRSPLVRVVVTRLAQRLADGMDDRETSWSD